MRLASFRQRNFQKRIFQSRLDENRFRVFVLERLYAGIKEHLDQTEDLAEPPHTDVEAGKETSNVPRIIEPVATDGLPDQPPELPNQKDGTPPPRPLSPHLSSTLHALSPLLKGMQSALEVVLVGGDKITEQTADRAGVPLGSLKEAKMLARDLWVGLVDLRDHQGKGGKEGVTVEQFYPIFGEGLAEKAFEVFRGMVGVICRGSY